MWIWMKGQLFALQIPISLYQLYLKGTELLQCIQYPSGLEELCEFSGQDEFRNG